MHRIALLVPLLLLVACDDGKASTEIPDGDTKAEAKPAAEVWSKVAAGASLAGKINARVADAEKAKLEPVIYVGATWCEPCCASAATYILPPSRWRNRAFRQLRDRAREACLSGLSSAIR